MLAFIVRNTLISLTAKDDEEADEIQGLFWRAFEDYILNPAYAGNLPVKQIEIEKEYSVESDWGPDETQSKGDIMFGTHLSPTDDSLLRFLWQFAGPDERAMIKAIQNRKVYRRLAVLSAAMGERKFNTMYDSYRLRRLANEMVKIEEDRSDIEEKIINKVSELSGEAHKEETRAKLKAIRPLILVDVPLKSIARVEGKKASLLYLPEDIVGIHTNQSRLFPQFRTHELETTPFDKDVGKIRILAHPDWRDFLLKFMPPDAVINEICS
jgi:hypothetical protein